MSAVGFTPIQLYRSTTASAVPTSGNLADGELAINTNDGKLYYKDSGGAVQLIASKAGASGDVVGPASATDNAVVRFDGTTGKLVQNSVVTIADSTGDISGVGQLNATTVDTTNVEVTNIKAKDGTAAATIADSTGVVSITANPVLSGGTANGVLYLNGSKVATSGSALTFDGTTLATQTSAGGSFLLGSTAVGTSSTITATNNNGNAYANLNYVALSHTWKYGSTTFASVDQNGTYIWYPLGTEGMRLTSTGLGIGTSSPNTILTVNAGDGVGVLSPVITTQSSTTTYGGMYAVRDGAGDQRGLVWQTFTANVGLGEKMRLDSSGNLGLGATPSAWGLGKAFEIGIAGNCVWGVQNADLRLGANMRYDGSNYRYVNNGLAARYDVANGTLGGHAWFTAPSGTAGNAISFTQAMTLDASGNFLLGTTSGVNAVATFGNNNTGSGYGTLKYAAFFGTNLAGNINPTNNWGLNIGWNYSSGGGETNIVWGTGAGTTPGLAFATWNGTTYTERARITSGGDLLVGRTSTIGGARVSAETTTGTPTYAAYLPTTGAETAFLFVNPNGSVGSITTNGSATAYNTSSDYRLKDNPQPLTNSGAFIDALKPKTWNWKSGGKGVGFIAHEVQEVSPGSVVGEKDGEQMQAMEYGSAEFIANIIAELQSLRQRVALLEGN